MQDLVFRAKRACRTSIVDLQVEDEERSKTVVQSSTSDAKPILSNGGSATPISAVAARHHFAGKDPPVLHNLIT